MAREQGAWARCIAKTMPYGRGGKMRGYWENAEAEHLLAVEAVRIDDDGVEIPSRV
jgi:hypothetical protein